MVSIDLIFNHNINTISDIWSITKAIFFLPGNLVLEFLGANFPKISYFLEISASENNGYSTLSTTPSGIISAFFWIFIYLLYLGLTVGRSSNR